MHKSGIGKKANAAFLLPAAQNRAVGVYKCRNCKDDSAFFVSIMAQTVLK